MKKPNYELSCKAKKIWETLRVQNGTMSKEEKYETVESLMNVVSDYNKKVLYFECTVNTSLFCNCPAFSAISKDFGKVF